MASGDPEIQGRVVRQTLEQAAFFRDTLGIERVETMYVGGGTPSILSGSDLSLLLGSLSDLKPSEWTIEANPDSLDGPFLKTCAAHGVTRLSLGIQAGRDGLLSTLGRPGRAADNARALGLISGNWKGQVNLDFLAGIPGQEPEDLEADLSWLAGYDIGHVSLYSLTVEPDTELSRMIERGEIRPDSEEHAEELWFHAKELLEGSGFVNYEISNFAKPGFECLHNMRYWRLEPYIGVGPGAVSTIPAAAAEALGKGISGQAGGARVVRMANPRDIGLFLSGRDNLWGMGVEGVSGEDFLLETLMMGLRTAAGIDGGAFRRRFGFEFDDFFPGRRGTWIAEGLAYEGSEALRLTEKGRLRLNRLLGEIASEIRRGLAAVPDLQWP